MYKVVSTVLIVTISLWPSPAVAQPIPSAVKNIVAFIYVPHEKGLVAAGTAFFVGIKHPIKEQAAVYLVTAKHVLRAENGQFFPRVYVRVNKKDGTSESLPVDLAVSGAKQNVFMHTDPAVDIAVITGFWPDEKVYDQKFLSDKDIASREDVAQLNIAEGSEVFFTGLFSAHPGVQRTTPIVRFGRVALVTDDLIEWGNCPAAVETGVPHPAGM